MGALPLRCCCVSALFTASSLACEPPKEPSRNATATTQLISRRQRLEEPERVASSRKYGTRRTKEARPRATRKTGSLFLPATCATTVVGDVRYFLCAAPPFAPSARSQNAAWTTISRKKERGAAATSVTRNDDASAHSRTAEATPPRVVRRNRDRRQTSGSRHRRCCHRCQSCQSSCSRQRHSCPPFFSIDTTTTGDRQANDTHSHDGGGFVRQSLLPDDQDADVSALPLVFSVFRFLFLALTTTLPARRARPRPPSRPT